MGVVRFELDDDLHIQAYGAVYGVEYTVREDGLEMGLTFDRYNRRLKLRYVKGEFGRACAKLQRLAEANGFDKITAKVKRADLGEFLGRGYKLEGIIPHFFRGQDAYVVSHFLSEDRFSYDRFLEESEILRKISSVPKRRAPVVLPRGYSLEVANFVDIPDLVSLYSATFETYPVPLATPDYILATMSSNVRYVLSRNPDGRIVSAASADIDFNNANAELTDCATIPEEQGRGLMLNLLSHLEEVLKSLGIFCAYSMARAQAPGMNRVFYNLGYGHYGRLINNCDISGSFEDINLWGKSLS
ncbi:MAG: putative beta-lysine N-acetyltransferase [Candidatus Sericytochromatia bacterium]|nr:putative beta-lysine N-acetyltransferase [Candidatus Sericytochromatia bacterium]